MDRGHQALLDPESLLEQHMDQGREAIGGAGGVGNDVMRGRLVLGVIHPHDQSDVLALGRSRDDHLLRPGGEMAAGFLRLGEEAGRFHHHLDAELGPGQLGRGPGADHENFAAVDHQDVVLGLVRSGLFRGDGALEPALRGVVLEQVGEIVGRDDVADGDDVQGRAEQALLDQCPEDQPADAAEPVDCDFYCHKCGVLCLNCARPTASRRGEV